MSTDHASHPNYEADNCPRCGTAQARMGDGFESFQAADGGPVTTEIDGAEVVRGCVGDFAYAELLRRSHPDHGFMAECPACPDRGETAVSTPDASSTWVCSDCIMLFANGETPPEMSEEETAAWSASIDANTDGFHVACGGEHEEGCANVEWDADGNYVSWIGSTDCSCETQECSWSSCGTCGSPLGGSRHAVTLFPIV